MVNDQVDGLRLSKSDIVLNKNLLKSMLNDKCQALIQHDKFLYRLINQPLTFITLPFL